MITGGEGGRQIIFLNLSFFSFSFFLPRSAGDGYGNLKIRFAERFGSPGNGDAVSVNGDTGF